MSKSTDNALMEEVVARQSVVEFIQWLGFTGRSVSHAHSMAVEFRPTSPDEALALFHEFEKRER